MKGGPDFKVLLLRPEFWVFLFILIPLSVDGNLNITIGHYDLRLPYLGCLAVLGLLVAEVIRTRRIPAVLNSYLGFPFWKWFLALLPIGIAGSIFSQNVERSALFTVWTVGTLTFVPFAAFYLYRKTGSWFMRLLLLYAGVQALVILLDAMVCIPTNGRVHLAKVMVYGYRADHELCRPHAWYQEPGYFCGFGLFAALLARAWSQIESAQIWKKISQGVYVLVLGAMLMTLSRLGWLGVGLFVVFEVFDWIRGKKLHFQKWMLAPLALLAVLFFKEGNSIYRHSLEGLVNPFEDSSIQYRMGRTLAAWSVFQENRLFGAGPGSAGAYLVDRIPDHPWLAPRGAEERQWLRHDPLSQSFYTEILSEWGILGFIAFFGGVGAWFWRFPRPWRERGLALFFLLALSTQTVPRFDLWWVVSSFWIAVSLAGRPASAK